MNYPEHDPWNIMSVAAISLHTLFESLTSAGFTEDQSLTLIVKLINQSDANGDASSSGV